MLQPLKPQVEERLTDYLREIGEVLRNDSQRASFAAYAIGLFGDSERKSAEPLAVLHCPDPKRADAEHQRFLHFIGQAAWADVSVRSMTALYAVAAMQRREPIEAWVFDDTGFLKQGKHSVGVQRQYTGSAGKVTNCQIGVSLTLASRTMQVPVDFDLYLPRIWADDPERREEAKVPDSIEFQTKPQLALAMADRALASGLPPGVVLADAAYGNDSGFRVGLRKRGLPYAVDIEGRTKVRVIGGQGKSTKGIAAAELGRKLGIGRYRRVTWREGSKRTLWSYFACCRVFIDNDTRKLGKREVIWLLIEWPPDEAQPAKFTLLTLPKKTSLKRMVRLSRQRWRTERVYEDMKGELGLDHFEGRSFRGWHHHVTIALACYAFTVAEQARSFPPSAARTGRDRPQQDASGTSLQGLARHRAQGHRSSRPQMAAALSHLPASQLKIAVPPYAFVTQ